MEKILIDFTNETKVSKIKENARQAILNDIIDYLSERYEGVKKVASNEIGVIVGVAKDEDGYASDVIVTLKATAKSWYSKAAVIREDGTEGRKVKKYDLDEQIKAYNDEKEAKSVPKK